jgi:hypothetical protein
MSYLKHMLIHEINLLNLINLLLAHIYCNIAWSIYGLIRFNEFVSQINLYLYN